MRYTGKKLTMKLITSCCFAMFLPNIATALNSDECAAIESQLDGRIAANAGGQYVAIATQMRDSIVQSCAMLDRATIDQMMIGLDQMLPVGSNQAAQPQKSDAERRAERDAQRAEADRRRSERDQRRAAARAKEAAEQALLSDAVQKAPTGRSEATQAMDREDSMWGVTLLDRDVYQGKARLLYQTFPSRSQGSDRAYHFYVVTIDGQNNITQNHIFDVPTDRTITASLLPGQDQIVVQQHSGSSNEEVSSLARWSISDSVLLTQTKVPELASPYPLPADQKLFKLVTGAGELLYTQSLPVESGRNARTGVSWMLTSPDGEVSDQGRIEHDFESVATNRSYRSVDGKAGLVLDVLAKDERGIDSQLQIDDVSIGEVVVRPIVMGETRFYEAGSTETGRGLPAIERRHVWLNLENVDQSLMINGESTRITQQAERGKRLDESLITTNNASRHKVAIASGDAGISVLVRNNFREDVMPPTYGLWLHEYGPAGARRDTHLDLNARHLKANFHLLSSDGNNGLYVGSADAVMRLNNNREIVAYARPEDSGAVITAMIADDKNVWLFGTTQKTGDTRQRAWVERLQF